MKKILSMILSLVCIVSLVACGDTNVDENKINNETNVNSNIESTNSQNNSSETNKPNKITESKYVTEKLKGVYDKNIGLRVLVKGDDIPEFTIVDPEGKEYFMEDGSLTMISDDGYIGVEIKNTIIGSYKIKYLRTYKDKLTIETEYMIPFVTVDTLEADSSHIKFKINGLNAPDGTYSIDALLKNSKDVIFVNLISGDLNGTEYDIPLDTSVLSDGEYVFYVNIDYELNKAYETAFGQSGIITVNNSVVAEE